MSAGREGEHLLAVVRKLYAELGFTAAELRPSDTWLRGARFEVWDAIAAEDEQLVLQLREEMARLAWASRGDQAGDTVQDGAVRAALEGAELVIRGEILLGNRSRLGSLLPSFAFLATLPLLGKQRALGISRRAEELLSE